MAKRFDIPKAAVIAHRGAAAQAPENTIIAFQRAKQLGAKIIECDVMLTDDLIPVVIHDAAVDRTTNAVGDVSGFTYEELGQLDAGSWFNPNYENERIPSLADVLNWAQSQAMQVNVEIKPAPSQEIATVAAIDEVISKHWSREDKPLLSSFSLVVLENCFQTGINCPLGMLMDVWDDSCLEMAKRFACNSIHINVAALTQERVYLMKAAGFQVMAYTINDYEIAETVFSWGVDAIFSDLTDNILTLL